MKKKKTKPVLASCQKKDSDVGKVRKSNVFIDGRYRFNLHEQKIMLHVISKVKMDEKDFTPYFVEWKELKAISNNYLDSSKRIDASCERLKNKTIKIKKDGEEDNFGFLSGWKVQPGRGVSFRIDPGMKAMLLDLLKDGNFTLFNLECAMSLTSSHSIRMYEILKSNQWKHQPVVLGLDDLKWKLDIDPSNRTYSDFANFRTHILDKAKKAFKEHTDIFFEYYPIKEGRKVVSLEIHIRENLKYQRTVQAESIKTEINLAPGQTVIIAGDECVMMDGTLMYKEKTFTRSQVLQFIKEGKAKIK